MDTPNVTFALTDFAHTDSIDSISGDLDTIAELSKHVDTDRNISVEEHKLHMLALISITSRRFSVEEFNAGEVLNNTRATITTAYDKSKAAAVLMKEYAVKAADLSTRLYHMLTLSVDRLNEKRVILTKNFQSTKKLLLTARSDIQTAASRLSQDNITTSNKTLKLQYLKTMDGLSESVVETEYVAAENGHNQYFKNVKDFIDYLNSCTDTVTKLTKLKQWVRDIDNGITKLESQVHNDTSKKQYTDIITTISTLIDKVSFDLNYQSGLFSNPNKVVSVLPITEGSQQELKIAKTFINKYPKHMSIDLSNVTGNQAYVKTMSKYLDSVLQLDLLTAVLNNDRTFELLIRLDMVIKKQIETINKSSSSIGDKIAAYRIAGKLTKLSSLMATFMGVVHEDMVLYIHKSVSNMQEIAKIAK